MSQAGEGVLTSLPELDELRAANLGSISRRGNVDVMQMDDSTASTEELALCHLPFIFPFSDGTREPWNALGTYEGAFGIALAAQHLNTGDGSIVPEVAGLADRCNIRFTLEALDTELAESTAVDQTIDLTDPDRFTADPAERLPCAILGAARSAVSIPTSIVSGLRGYPQFSPISTSAALDDTAQYPLFGRTIPSDDGTAIPLVLYMRHVLGVRYLGVLNIDDAYGRAYATGIQLAAQEFAPDMVIQREDVNVAASDDALRRVVEFLADTQYTFFFGIFFAGELAERIMNEAVKQGIAGTGRHNWVFADAIGGSVTDRNYERGSTLEKAFRGTSMLSAVGGISGMDVYDKLGTGLRELKNEDDIRYMRTILPSYEDGEPVDHDSILNGDTFLSAPGLVAPFLYDATIALGLAACDAAADSDEDDYFDGPTHFNRVLANQFAGTSGDVVFLDTGTRDPESALFSLTNFIDDEELSTDATVQFKAVEASVFRSGEWEELVPYVFNDGTTNIPRDLPELETDSNYLSPGLRGLGLALCAIIIIFSVGFAAWTWMQRGQRVVRASQPIFLLTICAGTLFMGASIIPLIIDRGVASEQGCDAACIAFPWLLAVGFSITFASLFTKTHRVNQIFKNAASFKRVKISAWDVAKPMLVLIGANILVLSLWTALAPPHFDTITVTEDQFDRPTETFGFCVSDSPVYVAILGAINAGVLIFSVYEAYSARSISTEFSESEYIFKILVLILLVFFIGIPVLVIARDNPAAYAFVFAGIIFTVCCSVLLLIFVPKYLALKEAAKKSKEKQERKQERKEERKQAGLTSEVSSTSRLSSAESEAEGVKFCVADGKAQRELEDENKRLRREVQKYQGRKLSMGSSCPNLSVSELPSDVPELDDKTHAISNGDEEDQMPPKNHVVSFGYLKEDAVKEEPKQQQQQEDAADEEPEQSPIPSKSSDEQ